MWDSVRMGQKSSWRNVSPFGGFGGRAFHLVLVLVRIGKRIKKKKKKLLYSIAG